MLKAEIAGEEVLSNKEITISQEMLKTSSTILNNCYPKSWETAHDYISNFYFPKDYSQCKIYDIENITPIVGTRVSGNNFSINYDSSLSWDFEQLKGNTTQDSYSGKNLFNIGSSINDYFATNNDGRRINTSVNISDYVSAEFTTNQIKILSYNNSGYRWLSKIITLEKNTNYTISASALHSIKVVGFDNLENGTDGTQLAYINNQTLTPPKTFNSGNYNYYVVTMYPQTAGNTYTDIQIEKGTLSSSFEPYVGGTPSPNPSYPQAINNVTGRQEIEVCGKNLLDLENKIVGYGFDNTNNIVVTSSTHDIYYIPVEAGKTYVSSAVLGTSSGNIAYAYSTEIPQENTPVTGRTTTAISILNNGTFTAPTGAKYLLIRLVRESQILTKWQIEKGNQATSYEPYIGNTYEINLGKNIINLLTTTNTPNNTTINSTDSNEITITATATTYSRLGITKQLEKGTYTISCLYELLEGSETNLKANTIQIMVGGSLLTQGSNTGTTFTLNDNSSVEIRFLLFTTTAGTNGTKVRFYDIQLEKGSQATSYSVYKTPIELCKIGDYQDTIKKSNGKNLFDKDNCTYLDNANVSSSSVINIESNFALIYIKLKAGKYTISNSIGSYQWLISDCEDIPEIGTTTSPRQVTTATSVTYTLNAEKYLLIRVSKASYSVTDFIKCLQIEEGETATTYEPYGKVWYKEGKIGKVTLDGTENWQLRTNDGTNYVYSITSVTDYLFSNTITGYSNYFSTVRYTSGYVNALNGGVGLYFYYTSGSSSRTIYITTNTSTTASDFKTWLNNHNVIVEYPLANPTYEVITDTELIEQLEAIELLSGLNNISVNNFSQAGDIQIYYNYRNAETITNMIFCGVIKNTGSVSLNPREPHYCDLQVLDFKTFLSEGKTLDFVISNKTITEAINMVINSISDYGFILGNIEIDAGNDIIGAYSTLNKTPYDVFQYLADISQSRWFTRVIDENTIAIDFYDLDKMPQADDIEYTEQYFKDNNIVDISFSYNTGDYRNKQEIISQQVYGNVNTIDNITSGGYEKTFITSQTIGRISSIKVDGVEKTFITTAEKSLGLSADFYYAAGKNEVESEISYAAGQVISISYIPLVKGRRTVNNQNEISRISEQTNRNGIISRYEERNDILDGDELTKVAETYIKYKGTPEIILNVVTVNKDLFEIGQQVYFNMPSVQDLATNYMVKKKNIEITQIGEYGNVFYTYELSSSFNSESAINFFDNQRRKAEGNITEDEFITRNVEVDNTALIIFDGLQIEEVTPTGDNTLNSTLNSPFIN